ncbi:MAG: VTT domain-containing protein [Deltaproteobacteria bacterium]|nr:VTT domain-containing protein [Deltaproteobacteria bacterium]
MRQTNQVNWLRLAMSLIGLIGLSFGLAYLLQDLGTCFHLPLNELVWLAYLSVFATTLVCNFTIIAPVPIATAIMIAAATRWNPIMVALAASIGGTLGELSGYYAGYLGKKIAVAEHMGGYNRVEDWMNQHGLWAIFFLALQPVIPFDIGGLVAGAARMPLQKFLPALWAGKLIKYIILCYSGIGLINFLPFWSH